METTVPSDIVRRQCNALIAIGKRGGALTATDFRGCRWIEGEPKPLRRGMFCGLPVVPGESWCAEHRSVVFREDSASGQ